MDGTSLPPLALRHPQPPSPPRCNGGSDSNMLSKTTMCGSKRPYDVPRCIESLPDELLFDILVCLPADFLYDIVRFVCRKWCHIIHSRAFANAHFHHSTYGLLLSLQSHKRRHSIYVTAAQGRIETSELNYKCRTEILGGCNGTLVVELRQVSNEALSARLVNPATKRSFLLPSVPSHSGVVHMHRRCGIAYSSASMKYKVTLPYFVDGQSPHQEGACLDIVTVGVDKSWRRVELRHLLAEHVMALLEHSPLTTEGFLHWGNGSHVLTFNVETEIFTMSQLPLLPPQSYQKNDYYYRSTGRCLSALVGRGGLSWEIWEMKPESGEWRKLLHKIELGAHKWRLQYLGYGEVLFPLGWIKYPEVLLFSSLGIDHACIYYNLRTHEINSIKLPDRPISRYRAFVHRSNLV